MKCGGLVPVVLASLCILGSFDGALSLNIQVVDVEEGKVEMELSDSNAVFQDRSYLIPTKKRDAIRGPVVYPNPRNACSAIDPAPNDSFIAYLEEYSTCPELSELSLKGAGFSAFISYSSDSSMVLNHKQVIPQALFFKKDFAQYIANNVLSNVSRHYEIVMWDDSFLKLERLFIIFGAILMVAVLLSIGVFCFSLFCRMALVRWRTRGLSGWQVRALPKRKFHKAKESTDTCSICLEEFKEGETVRVLPCDHVFHPKCVDEWLRKWNRTCPLCKSTIKRKGGRIHNPSALTDDNEASLLLPQEERVSLANTDGRARDYGSSGATPTHGSSHHRRESGSSSSGDPRNSTNQTTSAEIELSVGAELELSVGSHSRGRSTSPTSFYETPLNSDVENTPSYTTAHSSNVTEQV